MYIGGRLGHFRRSGARQPLSPNSCRPSALLLRARAILSTARTGLDTSRPGPPSSDPLATPYDPGALEIPDAHPFLLGLPRLVPRTGKPVTTPAAARGHSRRLT